MLHRLISSVEVGHEEAEYDHDFESSDDHKEGQENFGRGGEKGVIFDGSDHTQAGADVVESSGDGAKRGFHIHAMFVVHMIFIMQNHQEQGRNEEDHEYDADIHTEGSSHVAIDILAGDFQGSDDMRSKGSLDFKHHNTDKEHDTNDLDAAAGRAGRPADEHKHDEEPAREAGPFIEIIGAVAGGGHDGDGLKRSVTKGGTNFINTVGDEVGGKQ